MFHVNVQPYQSGYTAPARPPSDETSIDIGYVLDFPYLEAHM